MADAQIVFDKINKLVEDLKALQPLNPDYQRKLDKKFRLEFNYNSNHIEGNTLTYGETELLLIFDDTKGNHTLREYEEMKAHDVAYQLIHEWANETERPLSEQHIKNLNEILLVRPFWKDAVTPDGQHTRRQIKVGDYKEHPNSVRLQNGEMFDYASPMETPILMGELVAWFRTETEKKELHPVALAALLHYKFVRIHPFDDGNGRISRLLMNYVLFSNNYPPIIIKSANKRQYLSALNRADTGDLEAFIQYIAEQVVWSLETSIKAAKGESIEEVDDLDKEIAVLKKELGKANVLEQAATAENVAQVIEENIIPLFILIEERCEELKEFFFDFDKIITYQIAGTGAEFGLGSKESIWSVLIENWLYNNIKRNEIKIQKIDYYYKLKGFKKTISAPTFGLRVDIYLNEFNYTIEVNTPHRKYIQFPYNKKLDVDTLKDFVSPLMKELIEDIKRANNQK
jgi:Fic family protein